MKHFSSSKNNNSKGKRAGRITFYCEQCECVHHDHKMKDVVWFDEDVMVCRSSFENMTEY